MKNKNKNIIHHSLASITIQEISRTQIKFYSQGSQRLSQAYTIFYSIIQRLSSLMGVDWGREPMKWQRCLSNQWTYEAPKRASLAWKAFCATKQCFNTQIQRWSWMEASHYSIKRAYKFLQGGKDTVCWAKDVWNKLTVPKHRSFPLACYAL